jgi:hypothetical protein
MAKMAKNSNSLDIANKKCASATQLSTLSPFAGGAGMKMKKIDLPSMRSELINKAMPPKRIILALEAESTAIL